jgi:hypothetical protein
MRRSESATRNAEPLLSKCDQTHSRESANTTVFVALQDVGLRSFRSSVLKNRAALVEPLHSEPIGDKRPYLFGKAGLEIGVQIGCSKSSSGLLGALNQAIRAAVFQVITSEP